MRDGRVPRGVVEGLVATGGMTSIMWVADRSGLLRGLPPRQIIDHLLPGLDDRSAKLTATFLHFAIGASGGAVLARMWPQRRGGVPFGLLLWLIGYEGVVPVLGVLPPAHLDHPARATAMIGAHLVYGSLLGRLLRLGPPSMLQNVAASGREMATRGPTETVSDH